MGSNNEYEHQSVWPGNKFWITRREEVLKAQAEVAERINQAVIKDGDGNIKTFKKQKP